MNGDHKSVVQIEISTDKLESLFHEGVICASDFRCLNSVTQRVVRDLCLSACMKSMGCKFGHFQPSTGETASGELWLIGHYQAF